MTDKLNTETKATLLDALGAAIGAMIVKRNGVDPIRALAPVGEQAGRPERDVVKALIDDALAKVNEGREKAFELPAVTRDLMIHAIRYGDAAIPLWERAETFRTEQDLKSARVHVARVLFEYYDGEDTERAVAQAMEHSKDRLASIDHAARSAKAITTAGNGANKAADAAAAFFKSEKQKEMLEEARKLATRLKEIGEQLGAE